MTGRRRQGDKGDNGAHRGPGTEGSNPSPSTGESAANLTSSITAAPLFQAGAIALHNNH